MAAPWKLVESEEDVESLAVRLKPILGVEPTVYVPVVWAILLLGALFLLLVLPGVRNPGAEVSVTTVPAGAGVYVDGTRVAATPATVFVADGDRTITTELAGDRRETTLRVDGRRLGTLLVPRRMAVHHRHRVSDPAATVEAAIADFAAWALNDQPSAQFQQPPIARDTARLLWASGTERDRSVASDNPAQRDPVTTLWDALLAHGAAPQAADILGGMLRSAVPGAAFHPGAAAELVQYFIQADTDSPFLYRVVQDLAGPTEIGGRLLRESSWLTTRRETVSTALLAGSLVPDERGVPTGSTRTLRTPSGAVLPFGEVPSGRYTVGYPLRDVSDRGVPLEFREPFWMLHREVSRRDFAAFVAAVPRWGPDNRAELVAAGVAAQDYLADWPEEWRVRYTGDAPEAQLPVRYVSWYAASAYADWLSAALDGGETVRLPTAAEWEYAAFLDSLGGPSVVAQAAAPAATGSGNPGALGMLHLAGNVWEWTDDWYARRSEVFSPVAGDQRVVAGGSFATGQAGHNLLGAQPPTWTTPYLGFRVVIVDPEAGGRYDG